MVVPEAIDQLSTSTPPPRRDALQRWIVVWHVIFYIALIVPTALALCAEDLDRPPGLVLGLSIVLGLWYTLVMVWWVPRAKEKWVPYWTVLYLAVAIGLWIPLALAYPAYYITVSTFFGLMWGALPFGLAVAGNIIMLGLIFWLQSLIEGEPFEISGVSLIIGGFALAWSVLLALWMRTIMRESTQRKLLIEQLEAAQAELADAERQAGVMQERQRLAQEIHDTLAQGFTSIVMQLEAGEQALPVEAVEAQAYIQRAREMARRSLVEARRLVQALRPSPLDGASLPDALERVTKRWGRETGIQVEFTMTGNPYELHPDAEVTLLRATQEALANVRKHAQADLVNVTLSYMDDQLILDVKDNGIGFDEERMEGAHPRFESGYGLPAMRQRVAQFGGDVILESKTGGGSTLVVRIPIGVDPGE
jgi:signal transduction histidine kinase